MINKTNLQKFMDLGGKVDVEFFKKTRMLSGTEDFDTITAKELTDLLDYSHAYPDDSDTMDDTYSIYAPDGTLLGEEKLRDEAEDIIAEYLKKH